CVAGLVEGAVGGRGPAAEDGENGALYHYLQIKITPKTLTVAPVGVRRLKNNYRREAPMPVFHAPELPETRPPWRLRRLEAVEIRRGQPPRPRWAQQGAAPSLATRPGRSAPAPATGGGRGR